MPSIPMLYVLIAAFCHATWNLAAKKAAHARHLVWLYSIAGVLLYLPVLPFVGVGELDVTPSVLLALTATGVAHFAYSLSLQHGYRVGDLSIVYPVARGSGPLLSFFAAIILLGEEMTIAAVGGMALVVFGIFLLAGATSPLQTNARLPGIAWGLVTGSIIATYTIIDGWSVKSMMIPPLLVDWSGNLFRAVILAPRALREWGTVRVEARRYWMHASVIAVLGTLGYVLVLTAMKSAPVSRVAPARELSMLVGALYGFRILGEGDVFRRLLASGFIGCGVLLLLA